MCLCEWVCEGGVIVIMYRLFLVCFSLRQFLSLGPSESLSFTFSVDWYTTNRGKNIRIIKQQPKSMLYLYRIHIHIIYRSAPDRIKQKSTQSNTTQDRKHKHIINAVAVHHSITISRAAWRFLEFMLLFRTSGVNQIRRRSADTYIPSVCVCMLECLLEFVCVYFCALHSGCHGA